jgi:hypothetical protein
LPPLKEFMSNVQGICFSSSFLIQCDRLHFRTGSLQLSVFLFFLP